VACSLRLSRLLTTSGRVVLVVAVLAAVTACGSSAEHSCTDDCVPEIEDSLSLLLDRTVNCISVRTMAYGDPTSAPPGFTPGVSCEWSGQ